jgi:hypothetical protein
VFTVGRKDGKRKDGKRTGASRTACNAAGATGPALPAAAVCGPAELDPSHFGGKVLESDDEQDREQSAGEDFDGRRGAWGLAGKERLEKHLATLVLSAEQATPKVGQDNSACAWDIGRVLGASRKVCEDADKGNGGPMVMGEAVVPLVSFVRGNALHINPACRFCCFQNLPMC